MSKILFHSKALNDVVVDGVCECGHLERDHGSQMMKIGNENIRVGEGGSCCVGQCGCSHFRWVRWMTATEFSETLPTNQEDRLNGCCAHAH